MTISLRLSEQDALLIKKYAEIKGLSISELVRQAVLEKIENEFDVKAYKDALNQLKEDNTTYSLSEVEKKLGLWFIK
mgnify:FL=1